MNNIERMWRVLIRVVAIFDDTFVVVVPAWSLEHELTIQLINTPPILRSELKVGLRFFAKANLSADPETRMLQFDFTEVEIPKEETCD